MKSCNKISILLAVIVSGFIVHSLALAAAPPNKIAGGKHDLSWNGASIMGTAPGSGDGVLGNQTCIYCHTPHNAGSNKLLWNKAGNGNTAFRLYTSSTTLSPSAKASLKAGLSANSPSLFCLSCHDGKTAINVLHAGGQGTAPGGSYPADSRYAFGNTPVVLPNTWTFGDPVAGLGGASGDDLSNDHPVGFSYTAAQSDKPTALRSTTDVASYNTESQYIKFYGSTSTLECSSCHNPHADNTSSQDYKPFLVMMNTGSALCLSCHNK